MSRASESVNIPAEGQVVKDAEIMIVDRSEILLMPYLFLRSSDLYISKA
jgi:hypothetical protein